MTIVKRLILTLSVALLALVGIACFELYQQALSVKRFEEATSKFIVSVNNLNAATYAFINVQSSVINQALLTDDSHRGSAQEVTRDSLNHLNDALWMYEKNNVSDLRDRELMNADLAKVAAYRSALGEFFTFTNAGLSELATKSITEGALHEATASFVQALANHIAYKIKLAKVEVDNNRKAYDKARLETAGLVAVVLLLGLYMSIQLVRTVRGGLSSIRQTLVQVSQSLDFTQRAEVLGKDEISQTAGAFNDLLERLQSNLNSILQGANQVAIASQALAQTATQVATAADSQRATSSDVAETLELITQSVHQVAESAEESRRLAQEAGALAKDGSDTITQSIRDVREISVAVDSAAHTIRELEVFSSQVSSIVAIIEDIAGQTNLLALNAAIEAARAGEMGRGFAVVADEVRQLADRTTTSTQEISSTIRSIQERSRQATELMHCTEELVRTGVSRADEADNSIQRIGSATSSTAHKATEISSAIMEQGSATKDIAAQVEKIAEMSVESSSAAQQVANNARQLDELARQQITTLSFYRL